LVSLLRLVLLALSAIHFAFVLLAIKSHGNMAMGRKQREAAIFE